MTGRSRVEFWESIARRIQRRFHTRFMAQQCERKWRNLVRDFNVSKRIIIINIKIKYLKNYFNIFRISVSGGMEPGTEGGRDVGRDTTGCLERDFGTDLVIIKNFSIKIN
jgi:hypothetical protein